MSPTPDGAGTAGPSRATPFTTGVIEGFYGRPWSHAARLAYADWLRPLGLDYYLYAPKCDSRLRRCWAQPWPADEWAALRALAARYASCGAGLGIGLSPFALHAGLDARSRQQLRDKVAQINELGAPLLAILFDDMPGAQADLAERQLDIVHCVLDASSAHQLLVCPTYYSTDPVLERVFGQRPDRYWEVLGAGLPAQVGVFWTGTRVCAERMDAADLATINSLLRRPVTLWDNYPVNDSAQRCEHLYLHAPPARDPALARVAAGHFCNAMNQPLLSLPALAALGRAYGRGQASEAWLGTVLGAATLAQLRSDAECFSRCARSTLDTHTRARLEQRYQALAAQPQESAAAAEVLEWLRGLYAFDPDCLTD